MPDDHDGSALELAGIFMVPSGDTFSGAFSKKQGVHYNVIMETTALIAAKMPYSLATHGMM